MASGKHKLRMSKKEWLDMGSKGGWLSKEAYGQPTRPVKGQGSYSVELYRDQDGIVSVSDEFGALFQATIVYNYTPPEPKEYDSGQLTYPGVPPSAEITSIIDDSTGAEVPVNHESIIETFRDSLISDYEESFHGAYDDAMDAKLEQRKLGL